MFNLIPWRERRHKFCVIGVSISILLCYSMTIGFMCYQGLSLYHQQAYKQPIKRIKQQPSTQLLRLGAAYTIVQSRFSFMRHLLQRLTELPKLSTLERLTCHQHECELRLQIKTQHIFSKRLTDIQQGACPTCFQATLHLHL